MQVKNISREKQFIYYFFNHFFQQYCRGNQTPQISVVSSPFLMGHALLIKSVTNNVQQTDSITSNQHVNHNSLKYIN